MEISLKGKKAVITGASGQIGRVIARTFASCGADIALHYLQNKSQAEELAFELARDYDVKAFIVQADIKEELSVNNMRDKIFSEFGGESVDICVNNAVVQYGWASILEQDLSDYYSQFESIVKHNVLMAKAFIPGMIKKNSGKFIGINTECSYLGNPKGGAYASAKQGMHGLYRVLAKEVGMYNINVNQVAPGWIRSQRERAESGENNTPDYDKNVPLKRRGTEQEVANAVLFLASDLSDFITGVCIPVSGGTVMV